MAHAEVTIVQLDEQRHEIANRLSQYLTNGYRIVGTFEHASDGWCAILQRDHSG